MKSLMKMNRKNLMCLVAFLFLVAAVVFEVLSAANNNVNKLSDVAHVSDVTKYHNLALVFALVGIGLYAGCNSC